MKHVFSSFPTVGTEMWMSVLRLSAKHLVPGTAAAAPTLNYSCFEPAEIVGRPIARPKSPV